MRRSLWLGRVSLMPFWSFATRGGLEDNMKLSSGAKAERQKGPPDSSISATPVSTALGSRNTETRRPARRWSRRAIPARAWCQLDPRTPTDPTVPVPCGTAAPPWTPAAQHNHIRIEQVDHVRQRTREAVLVAGQRRSGALRLAETAAHLVDHVFPQVPVRQWVLSLPKRLRYFLHHEHALIGPVLRIFLDAVEDRLKAQVPAHSQRPASGQ